MPIIKYRGFTEPRHLPLTIDFTPRAERTDAEEAPDGDYTGRIRDGIVEVDVAVETYTERDFEAHYFPALTFARTLAHAPSFISGVPYTVFLDSVITPSGKKVPMVLADRRLGALTTIKGKAKFEQLVELALTDLGVGEMLSDATLMVTIPNYAPIAGGRIADSLVRLIAGGREAADWAKMRKALNATRDYVQFLSDHSTAPRHGHRLYIPGPEVHAIAEHSWTLIDRYLQLRLRGGDTLTEDEFPMLIHDSGER